MNVKNMQVISRYSGSPYFYKLCFTGELTDPYGEKNSNKENHAFSDFEDFLSFTWDTEDSSDSSISDEDLNIRENKRIKSTVDHNYSSFSDSDSDFGKLITKFKC